MDSPTASSFAISLADKAHALGLPQTYGLVAGSIDRIETHMSLVFLCGDRVYKLKKPLRLSYLDFSTLARREAACRAELRLNQALAADVYLGVLPLTHEPEGLRIGGSGEIVDWVVVMRRLDEAGMLDRRLTDGRPAPAELDRLATRLTRFYRRARHVCVNQALERRGRQRELDLDRNILLRHGFALSRARVRRATAVMARILFRYPDLLRRRRRRIVLGHGDLRAEHVWIGDHAVKVIDCLEFNASLRQVDPLDELAFLELDCERLGAAATGRRIRLRVQRGLGEQPPEALIRFYRCWRALLRARLAMAHLLEACPRTPAKWPRQAEAYLALAARDAAYLEARLNRPAGRSDLDLRAGALSPRR